MKDFITVKLKDGNTRDVYNWDNVFSRQTGSTGEIAMIIGAKNLGKTFSLRVHCIREFLKTGYKFVEICRTKDEMKATASGYFNKIKGEGYFKEYDFKTDKDTGYISKANKDEWKPICHFAALSTFQGTKRSWSFTGMHRLIFDEFIIDSRDRYHQYLPSEVMIFANILDTIIRENPGSKPFYKVYLMANACDLTCPYLRFFGVDKVPQYGFSFYNNRCTMLHYVKPWDSELRKTETLVGRMLANSEESRMIFDNEFLITAQDEIKRKPGRAKYMFALSFMGNRFSIWLDSSEGMYYVQDGYPKNSRNVFALTKKDNSLDYTRIEKSSDLLRLVNLAYYDKSIRYDKPSTRELFLKVLEFTGVK